MMTKDIRRWRAQERVQELKKFYKNVGNLVFFILFLGSINYISNRFVNPWFLYIVSLMSIGLAIDAVRTFVHPLLFKKWERRKIKDLLQNNNL